MTATRVGNRLRERIHAEILRLSTDIASGSGISDFAAYKQSVGIVEGLRQAETLLDDIERED